MKKQLSYSTRHIDNARKGIQIQLEKARRGIDNGLDLKETLYQRLDQRIAEKAYDWVINSLSDLSFYYAGGGDLRLQFDVDTKAAKENYYMASTIGVLCYEMIERGFSHHVYDSGYPYDFKKNNFNYTKAAILANEYDLALKIAGNDTVEGALLLQDYGQACAILPENPEDDSINKDEIRQCMWAIAHGDEKLFHKYLEKRIRLLRRYASLDPVTLDSWGLAVVKLAQQRGITCNLNVIELPYQLLDDTRIDTNGLFFSRTEQIRSIIDEKGTTQTDK